MLFENLGKAEKDSFWTSTDPRMGVIIVGTYCPGGNVEVYWDETGVSWEHFDSGRAETPLCLRDPKLALTLLEQLRTEELMYQWMFAGWIHSEAYDLIEEYNHLQ